MTSVNQSTRQSFQDSGTMLAIPSNNTNRSISHCIEINREKLFTQFLYKKLININKVNISKNEIITKEQHDKMKLKNESRN